jgi:hypothetical protein
MDENTDWLNVEVCGTCRHHCALKGYLFLTSYFIQETVLLNTGPETAIPNEVFRVFPPSLQS